MVQHPRKLGSRCWAPRALGNVPWHPFERKKHEFTEHWSTFHTERMQMPSGLARGGRLRLRRRWDSEALAGPAPRPTQAAGPRGPGVLTRQGGRHRFLEGQGREAVSKEPTQAPATHRLAGPCASSLCVFSCSTAASGQRAAAAYNVATSGRADQMQGLSRAVARRECAWLPSSPSASQTWESHHQGHTPGLP